MGTVANGTETQRLGRSATVGCGELADSVLGGRWLLWYEVVLHINVLAAFNFLVLSLIDKTASFVAEAVFPQI